MPNADEVLQLIDKIYDAAVSPERWPAVICAIGDAINSSKPGLGIYDLKTQAISAIVPRTDPDWLRAYEQHWASRNFLWQRSATMPVGALFRFETFLPRRDLVRTEIYNEFFHPQQMDVVLTGNILAEGSASGVVCFGRPWKYDRFGAEEEKLLSALMPHLQRAVQLHIRLARLEIARDSSAAMLDRLEHGALLVDAQAHVLFANRAAEAVLADPGGLRVEHGRLAASRVADTARLRALIAATTGHGSGGPLALARAERSPLMLLVAPLRAETRWLVHDQPNAIVFIKDIERASEPSLALFAEHFGLTPAQARLSREMANGRSLAAAAAHFGVSYATARTHLLQVFQRTNTKRQAELVALMLRWNDDHLAR